MGKWIFGCMALLMAIPALSQQASRLLATHVGGLARVGAHRHPVRAIAIDERDDLGGIFFAGEGMSSKYQSYLHAAYHSGTETADEIIEYMGYAFATGLSFSIRSLIPLAIAALLTK